MTSFGWFPENDLWPPGENGERIIRNIAASPQPLATVDYTQYMLVGNASSQTMTATSSKFILIGMGGNDTINGGDGGDVLIGDYYSTSFLNSLLNGKSPQPPNYDSSMIGNDSLNGGFGEDVLFADLGNDTLNAGYENDSLVVFVENFGNDVFLGGDGLDTLYFEDDYKLGIKYFTTSSLNLNTTASVEYVVFVDTGLSGTTAADVFDFSGVKEVDLAAGYEIIKMLDGSDRYVGSNVTYSIDSSGTFLLIGDHVLGGDQDDTLIGNKGNDILEGQSANDSLSGDGDHDTLLGGGGADILNGGKGKDSMDGGAGNDIFYVDSKSDVVVEASGGGTDKVITALTNYVLSANVEDLIHNDTTGFKGTGNSSANKIEGNSGADSLLGLDGNDTLTGGDGNDILDGGSGKDSMNGGAGDDVYFMDVAADIITEASNGGRDIINVALANYTLSSNFEGLVQTADIDFTGTGNGKDNTIVGNSGADTLNGLAGNDTLTGGAGKDVFILSSKIGDTNIDVIADFQPGKDTIELENDGSGLLNALPSGALDPNAFLVNDPEFMDADDRISYGYTTGRLFYDPDGSGSATPVQIAELEAYLDLSADDFLVI